MKPSSMACFMLYRWKGRGMRMPSASRLHCSSRVPNTSRVAALGVAVKAKKERFGMRPCAFISLASSSSSSQGSSGSKSRSISAIFILALALPDCELCASSMMTANFRPETLVSLQM